MNKYRYITVGEFIEALKDIPADAPLNSIGGGVNRGRDLFMVHFGKHYRTDEDEKTIMIPKMLEK